MKHSRIAIGLSVLAFAAVFVPQVALAVAASCGSLSAGTWAGDSLENACCTVHGGPCVIRTTPTCPKDGLNACCVENGAAKCIYPTLGPGTYAPGYTPSSNGTPICKNGSTYDQTTRTCLAPPLIFAPNVPIPGLFEGAKTVDSTLFARYVGAFFIYFLGIVGVLAVVMIMYGGYHYIVSAGNASKMTQGKDIINNAIIGLVLVFTTYLMLQLINPALVKLGPLSLNIIPQKLQIGVDTDVAPGQHGEATKQCKSTTSGRTISTEDTCFIPNANFVWPVSPRNGITSRVGPRDPRIGSSCHPGTDFSTGGVTGKDIIAPFDGKITDIRQGCGEWVVTLDAGDYYVRFVHVKKVDVAQGNTVNKGITKIGTTGGNPHDNATIAQCSGGPHLHVELYSKAGDIHDIVPCITG